MKGRRSFALASADQTCGFSVVTDELPKLPDAVGSPVFLNALRALNCVYPRSTRKPSGPRGASQPIGTSTDTPGLYALRIACTGSAAPALMPTYMPLPKWYRGICG